MKRIAFVIAITGILAILLINNLNLPETPIEKISKDDLNKLVKISGMVSNIKIYENNFTTFNLKSQGEITVICNCPDIRCLILSIRPSGPESKHPGRSLTLVGCFPPVFYRDIAHKKPTHYKAVRIPVGGAGLPSFRQNSLTRPAG